MIDSSDVHDSHDVDQFARALREDMGGASKSQSDSRGRKLRHDSEVIMATLLSGRADYLNVGAVNAYPKQNGSWSCKPNHTARKEYVRTMASEGGAFIMQSSHQGNHVTDSALPTIHTAKQLH